MAVNDIWLVITGLSVGGSDVTSVVASVDSPEYLAVIEPEVVIGNSLNDFFATIEEATDAPIEPNIIAEKDC